MQNAPNMETIEMCDGIIWYKYIVHVHAFTHNYDSYMYVHYLVHVHVATAHMSQWDGRVHLHLNEANVVC